MKKNTATAALPALELLERAVHLLRATPARRWLAYYVGAIPFLLGLLYFWADMSRGAYAQRRCPASAFGMALLFLWLKFWQSVFAVGLRDQLAGRLGEWNFTRGLRLGVTQGILQPAKLFLIPVAAVLTLPLPWVLAFFENATALGDGREPGVRALVRRAAAQARLWPAQNHLLLLVLSLLALVLWLNAFIALATAPSLLKMLLGLESAFTRAGAVAILNTTFLTAATALAWLVFDPLVKAAYVLRCFHGEARTDGADLLAGLARVRAANKFAPALLLAALLWPAGLHAAETTPAPPTTPAVSPAQLDDAVQATLQRDKYAWRFPREKIADDESASKSWLRNVISSFNEVLFKWARAVRDFIRDVFSWFNRHFHRDPPPTEPHRAPGTGWMTALRSFAYLLIALAAGVFVVLLWRVWRQGWRRPETVRAEVLPARPDLNDEAVTAAQLPEDEWLKLARELLERGELRLALRAFYFATLAHLATREIVALAQFKSNRDYETEVNRRARGTAELRAAFAANVRTFDRVWYGLYEVTAEHVTQFRANFDRIRSC